LNEFYRFLQSIKLPCKNKEKISPLSRLDNYFLNKLFTVVSFSVFVLRFKKNESGFTNLSEWIFNCDGFIASFYIKDKMIIVHYEEMRNLTLVTLLSTGDNSFFHS